MKLEDYNFVLADESTPIPENGYNQICLNCDSKIIFSEKLHQCPVCENTGTIIYTN